MRYPKAKGKSGDNAREILVDENGRCKICASPCDDIRAKYDAEIKENPKLKFDERINAIRDNKSMSPEQKLEAYKNLDEELSRIKNKMIQAHIHVNGKLRISILLFLNRSFIQFYQLK